MKKFIRQEAHEKADEIMIKVSHIQQGSEGEREGRLIRSWPTYSVKDK